MSGNDLYHSLEIMAYISSGTTTMTYDPSNREMYGGDSSGYQVYGDSTDNAIATYNQFANLSEAYDQLPGGVLFTIPSSGLSSLSSSSNIYSLPDMNGNVFAYAKGTGAAGTSTYTYDPFGNLTSSSAPNNASGGLSMTGEHIFVTSHER
jgi:hypothetical protein